MSSVDYTPVLLAQVTDLQMRLTTQESVIAALKAEVERLSGRPVNVSHPVASSGNTMRASVPLLPTTSLPRHDGPHAPRGYPRSPRPDGTGQPRAFNGHNRDVHNGEHQQQQQPRRQRPQVAPSAGESQERVVRPTMSLSDVLKNGEEVTLTVGTGKDSEGKWSETSALATFDGTDLVVTRCELISSLVGMKSSKPGEILYKFIDGLTEAGHVKRKFSIAPWKLCSVIRDGQKQTLEQLRTVVG